MQYQLGAWNAATMKEFDVAVVALLAVIMSLLLITLFVVLRASGRFSCSTKNKKRSPHIYETIDKTEDGDDEGTSITQILKIRVCSEDGTTVQQDMLIRVQVEAIPLPARTGASVSASPSSAGPPPGPKPHLVLKLDDLSKTQVLHSPDAAKPAVPPKTPKMQITPSMIKDPSLLQGPSGFQFPARAPVTQRLDSPETSGYLQPLLLRKDSSTV